MQRVKTKIIDCELFKNLQQLHGESYDEFMRSRLVPVIGNLCKTNVGMDLDLARVIQNEVNVIIHTAANTRWEERYDASLNVNVVGLSRLLGLALKCKNLLVFLHLSTAFVNPKMTGVILENSNFIPTEMDIDAEIKMASNLASRVQEDELSTEQIKLGIHRANVHGWQQAYQLTKAMGELLITRLKGKLPIVIVRPSLVESTIKDPFPGWIDGYRVLDPIIFTYGKGQLQGIVANPHGILDVVPVDIVVNVMVLAMVKHGIVEKPLVNVYHASSSSKNPLICHELFKFVYNYFTLFPLKNSRGYPIVLKDMKFFKSISEFSLNGLDTKYYDDKLQSQLTRMVAVYKPLLMLFKARFDDENTQNLFQDISLEEKSIFYFDTRSIDWKDYLFDIHIPGLRKHILKEEPFLARL